MALRNGSSGHSRHTRELAAERMFGTGKVICIYWPLSVTAVKGHSFAVSY